MGRARDAVCRAARLEEAKEEVRSCKVEGTMAADVGGGSRDCKVRFDTARSILSVESNLDGGFEYPLLLWASGVLGLQRVDW